MELTAERGSGVVGTVRVHGGGWAGGDGGEGGGGLGGGEDLAMEEGDSTEVEDLGTEVMCWAVVVR